MCRKCENLRSRAYYRTHLEASRTYARENTKKRYQKERTQILLLLGNKCSNPECPISPEKLDKRTLQIDHINNNGSEERKKFRYGNSRGYSSPGYIHFILKQIQMSNNSYQLLCPYCNWRKRYL